MKERDTKFANKLFTCFELYLYAHLITLCICFMFCVDAIFHLTNMQNGLTHAFVVTMASQKDLDYYVDEDVHHKAFVASLPKVMVKGLVLDFVDKEY